MIEHHQKKVDSQEHITINYSRKQCFDQRINLTILQIFNFMRCDCFKVSRKEQNEKRGRNELL
jgi:hypothetical protein